ncbi:cytochrome P450 [Streptomyces badius]
MTEPMTEPARQDRAFTGTSTEPTPAPPFPQDRECPYHPPTGYESLRAQGPLSRVTLFDGRPVWAVTGHALAGRDTLGEPRLATPRIQPGPFSGRSGSRSRQRRVRSRRRRRRVHRPAREVL